MRRASEGQARGAAHMASSVDRGIGSPPDPGAAGLGVCAAIAAASPCVITIVSWRVAGRPMHISLSRPGLVTSQIDSESTLRT